MEEKSEFTLKGIVLVKYHGKDANVTIPDGVRSIRRGAFRKNSAMTSLTIPEGVEKIPAGIYSECRNLKDVYFPSTLQKLNMYAFENCHAVEAFHVADIDTWFHLRMDSGPYVAPFYWGYRLCVGGEQVTELVIPENVTEIGPWAFCGCRGLRRVTLHADMRKIGAGAFRCPDLNGIYISDLKAYLSMDVDGVCWIHRERNVRYISMGNA